MPNYGTYAICPYFQSEDPLKIKCEGVVQLNKVNTAYVLSFSSGKEKKEWLKQYCETYQYGICPYSQLIQQQWDDTGKSVRQMAKRYLLEISTQQITKKKRNQGIKGQYSFKL